ncbi:MAG: hypothetical protein FWG30_04220 [Eubacteriaceae bacterium]|nr:hypothetical protein [Eubacteriaceae bacterium]
MAIIRKCDRCGNNIDSGLTSIFARKSLLLRGVPRLRADLCRDCLDELYQWMDVGKEELESED